MVIGTGMVFCAQSSQLQMCRSVPQIDAFNTRISTSSLPTSGTGTSSSHRPGSRLVFTTAFINFCTRKTRRIRNAGKHESSQVNGFRWDVVASADDVGTTPAACVQRSAPQRRARHAMPNGKVSKVCKIEKLEATVAQQQKQ